MAKRKKPKTNDEVKQTELEVNIEVLTLEKLVDHYVQLRFIVWDGTSRVTDDKPYFVFENLPDFQVDSNTRKTTKFPTMEDAEEFAFKLRDKMREQLLKSLTNVIMENEDEHINETDLGSSGVRGEIGSDGS